MTPNLPYLIPRVIRHFLPEGIVRAFLSRGLIIRPGLETRESAAAVERYLGVLSECNYPLRGKRVMVFGYGDRFGVGIGLLEAGASHVVLCDKFARPDERHNRRLLSSGEKWLTVENDRIRPRAEWMTLLHSDIRDAHRREDLQPVDLVLSNSVFEHLDDVEGTTRALASLTTAGGLHVHFVDLRDHYFRYPFEMLCYSERFWEGWLNPSSNHNRYRVRDYRRAFKSCFANVEIEIRTREDRVFRRLEARIRPEFISGNLEEDAAATIRVIASMPSG